MKKLAIFACLLVAVLACYGHATPGQAVSDAGADAAHGPSRMDYPSVGGDLTGSANAAYIQSLGGANNGGGAVPLTSGAFIRGPNASTAVKFRNAAGTADIAALSIDSSNDVAIDANGTGAAAVLIGQNASYIESYQSFFLNNATLQYISTVSLPTISQASESTAIKGQDLAVQPQQSTHATDQGGGNFVVPLQAPTGTGAEAALEITRAGTISVALGPLQGSGSTYSALWLGGSLGPNTTNYALEANASIAILNGASATQFAVGGSSAVQLTASEMSPISTNVVGLGDNTHAFTGLYTQLLGGSTTVPLAWAATASAIACGTGGTQTISAAQAATPGLSVTTGTLSSDCILDFGTNAVTGWYVVDTSGVGTIGAFHVSFKNGTQTEQLSALPAGGLVLVWTHGTNHIVVN